MKASAIWAAAALLAAAIGVSGSCLAAEGGTPIKPLSVLSALAGTAVSAAELGRERARGVDVNINGSGLNTASSSSNSIVGSPLNGMISNQNSINGDQGITSVLQNYGNNSIMQSTTTINITSH
jgi:hypothetical protein